MVEVFKTNVLDPQFADMLIQQIHCHFQGFRANFDLDDCDKILRISGRGFIDASLFINLLKEHGFEAQVLPD